MSGRWRTAGVVLAVGTLVLGACVERRVVYNRPMFAGLPGVQSNQPIVGATPKGYHDPTHVEGGSIVVEHSDGSKTLVSRSAAHLVAHIQRALVEDEEELFLSQVLSELTVRECRENGVEPAEAFRYLRQHRDEVLKTLARMQAGERSPYVVVQKLDDRVYRVLLTGLAARGLRWRGFDMILEGGGWDGERPDEQGRPVFRQSNWRLRWFVPAES
ncbi:MAG: hypothetical protein DYG93_11905 [Leptolyngbya sp. PLA2]|nr:hypothetical protein [Leptolyngbya sp.]MCE7972349.1 hypothetical protein [Leptolyngbya sp. PL-A2]MDL1905056.1 hypothetical protein [Synechococcales cyanobacterium CNB]GIK19956.1 MAG: hypothetical protein BroJett004_21200 [Planctomycetota bacterium]